MPRQTWINCEAGQTWMTQTKHDTVDPDNLTWLQQ